jgi:CRP/FNR family cyclic AMP-dependent transcriptional regulator
MMQSIADVLADQPVFAGLDEPTMATIAGCGVNTGFATGEYLLREGQPAATFYVLRSGRVALETDVPPRGPVILETLGPGEVVGWSWLFPPYEWHFDAVALEPIRAVALDGACLRTKCEADARLGFELTRRFAGIIVARLQATRIRLLDVYGDARG